MPKPARTLSAASGCSTALPVLQECLELVDREASVSNDTAHREGVDRIGPRDGEDSLAVRHDDVLALPNYTKPGLLQGAHRPEDEECRGASALHDHLDLTNVRTLGLLAHHGQILVDCGPDVLKGFSIGRAL